MNAACADSKNVGSRSSKDSMPGLYFLLMVKLMVLFLKFSSHGSILASPPYSQSMACFLLTTRYILTLMSSMSCDIDSKKSVETRLFSVIV